MLRAYERLNAVDIGESDTNERWIQTECRVVTGVQ